MKDFFEKHTLLLLHIITWGLVVIPPNFFDTKFISDNGMLLLAYLSIIAIIKDKKYFAKKD